MHESTVKCKIELNEGKDYLVYREGSGGTVEIFDIAVGSERLKGQGKALVEMLKIISPGKTIFAITRRSNHGAQAFYEKIGFVLCADLPQFYKDEDAKMYILHR